jgi:hypothetical protein
MVSFLFAEAQNVPVRQLFIWRLEGGIPQAAGNKAIRIALYNAWNNVNPNTVRSYWVGQQNDGLLFGKKDDTWGDIGGYTDWITVPIYKSFKVSSWSSCTEVVRSDCLSCRWLALSWLGLRLVNKVMNLGRRVS